MQTFGIETGIERIFWVETAKEGIPSRVTLVIRHSGNERSVFSVASRDLAQINQIREKLGIGAFRDLSHYAQSLRQALDLTS